MTKLTLENCICGGRGISRKSTITDEQILCNNGILYEVYCNRHCGKGVSYFRTHMPLIDKEISEIEIVDRLINKWNEPILKYAKRNDTTKKISKFNNGDYLV